MTELEKRAEEYSIREIPFIECISQLDLERLVKQAYLAGLHEGQPKWRDLRKDPNDLPKLNKTDMSDYVITDRGVSYYNGRLKSWYIQNDYRLSDKVIAWCEIPTFNFKE